MTLRTGEDTAWPCIDRTMWRNRFGRGVGPVVGQNTEW